jgi:hypothetical protein
VNERIRVLDELGGELDRVARRQFAHRSRTVRGPRRLSVLAIIVVLLVLAAAAAAAVLMSSGSPLPAPRPQDLESGGIPIPSTVHLAGLDVADPEAGAPRWDLRLSRSRSGETCTAVGQVLDGQFGIVGLDHVFRALPLGGVDVCGFASPGGPVLAGARVFSGSSSMEARTVVNGVAGVGTRSVTAYGPEGARALTLGPDGSFLAVYRGYVEDVRPRVVIVSRRGSRRTVSFAQSSAFEIPDPQGGAPWQVNGEPRIEQGAYLDENCVQASRVLNHANPSVGETAITPEICGRLASNPLFVLMRRFVAGEGERSGYPWGNNPARTLIYGAAAPRVTSLSLAGVGLERQIQVDPRGGVFMAVLDGQVDPRSLTLTAHMKDGSKLRYTRSANVLESRTNKPLVEPPVPAYREPVPAAQIAPPSEGTPITGTLTQTAPVRDPAGGPPWVLRSWRSILHTSGSTASGHGVLQYCFQFGVIDNGNLVLPRTGAAPILLNAPGHPTSESNEERCNSTQVLTHRNSQFSVESYLADPYAYSPTVVRTIVSGQTPLGSTHVLLIGAGAARPLAVDANDAFLIVLPGRYWANALHLAYTLDGRTYGLPGNAGTFQRGPGLRPEARTPDPDGGAPWGFAERGSTFNGFGRIVEGRIAGIDEARGTVTDGPADFTEGLGHLPGQASSQVDFNEQRVEDNEGIAGHVAPLTRAEIERRTLPGRTIITGIALPDVVSVTLTTPSDVRTLRPSGRHHLVIAVYPGVFYQAAPTATILLRDGKTITEPILGFASRSVRSPTPLEQLQDIYRQQAAVEHDRHLTQAQRTALSAWIPAQARLIKLRMAYERAHPGLLPAP